MIYLLGPIDPTEPGYLSTWIRVDRATINKKWKEMITPYSTTISNFFPQMSLELPWKEVTVAEGNELREYGCQTATTQINEGYIPPYDVNLYFTTNIGDAPILYMTKAQAAELDAQLTGYMIGHLIYLLEGQIVSKWPHLFSHGDDTLQYYDRTTFQQWQLLKRKGMTKEEFPEIDIFPFECGYQYDMHTLDMSLMEIYAEYLASFSSDAIQKLSTPEMKRFDANPIYGNVNPALHGIWRNLDFLKAVEETSFIFKNGELFEQRNFVIDKSIEFHRVMRMWLYRFDEMDKISEEHPETKWSIVTFSWMY